LRASVVTKRGLVTDEAVGCLRSNLARLHPGARLVVAYQGPVPVQEVPCTGDFEPAPTSPSGWWAREFAAEHTPRAVRRVVRRFVYRARRLVHPERPRALFDAECPGARRSHGMAWLAAHLDLRVIWSAACGGVGRVPGARLRGTTPRAQWLEHPVDVAEVEWVLDAEQGEPDQERFFIGRGTQERYVREGLDGALFDAAALAGVLAIGMRFGEPLGLGGKWR
jgi:G3E family GTPase